jgi:hypothetical protein
MKQARSESSDVNKVFSRVLVPVSSLHFRLAYSSTVRMEATYYSESSVDSYSPEYKPLQSPECS